VEPLAQRGVEGRVDALEEENGWELAGCFGCSCGGGCHCRDKDFFYVGPMQHISLTPRQQGKEKDQLAWHFNMDLFSDTRVFQLII
jgi:hypothetical protein